MQWYKNFKNIKYLLIVFASIIAVGSLYVSNALTSELKKEELNKMQVWAEAMRSLNSFFVLVFCNHLKQLCFLLFCSCKGD